LLALARTPLIPVVDQEAGLAGEALPGNRGELYARFVGRMLRRDTERQMEVQFPERMKQHSLATLALHMSQAQRLTCPRHEAVDVVASILGQETSETLERAEALVAACAGMDYWLGKMNSGSPHIRPCKNTLQRWLCKKQRARNSA